MSSLDSNRGTVEAIKQPKARGAVVDDTEGKLAVIWQKLLGADSVGVDQNFFDLGGDSSLAVRMFAEIEEVFKVKLPLATLYETPTIEELARVVRGETSTSGWSPLVAIRPEGSRPRLRLTAPRFRLIAATAAACRSTKTPPAAPRLSASNP